MVVVAQPGVKLKRLCRSPMLVLCHCGNNTKRKNIKDYECSHSLPPFLAMSFADASLRSPPWGGLPYLAEPCCYAGEQRRHRLEPDRLPRVEVLDALRDAHGARRRLDSELRHKGMLEWEETAWSGP